MAPPSGHFSSVEDDFLPMPKRGLAAPDYSGSGPAKSRKCQEKTWICKEFQHLLLLKTKNPLIMVAKDRGQNGIIIAFL
jgi:hypothetical protein